MDVFQDYASYYNMFYKDKDYKAEAQAVDSLLKKYGSKVEKIMNFGCGTGMHDVELSRMGYQCAGIDASPGMIDIAKENSKKSRFTINFQVADIRFYKTLEKYDAVISLFHVISYQNRNEDVLAAFQSARSIIEKGSIFIFDVWYGPGVLSDKPYVRVKEAEDEDNKLIRIARPDMHDKLNLVNVAYDVLVINKESDKTQMINEIHHMRYFFRPEMEMFLHMAGFQLIDNIDCQTLGETDYTSWTSYFIAKAI